MLGVKTTYAVMLITILLLTFGKLTLQNNLIDEQVKNQVLLDRLDAQAAQNSKLRSQVLSQRSLTTIYQKATHMGMVPATRFLFITPTPIYGGE